MVVKRRGEMQTMTFAAALTHAHDRIDTACSELEESHSNMEGTVGENSPMYDALGEADPLFTGNNALGENRTARGASRARCVAPSEPLCPRIDLIPRAFCPMSPPVSLPGPRLAGGLKWVPEYLSFPEALHRRTR